MFSKYQQIQFCKEKKIPVPFKNSFLLLRREIKLWASDVNRHQYARSTFPSLLHQCIFLVSQKLSSPFLVEALGKEGTIPGFLNPNNFKILTPRMLAGEIWESHLRVPKVEKHCSIPFSPAEVHWPVLLSQPGYLRCLQLWGKTWKDHSLHCSELMN